MKQYNTFIFDSYSIDPAKGLIELNYGLTSTELSAGDDDITFTETLKLPTPWRPLPIPSLDEALFALHLIGGISYYKTCIPKKMEIRLGSLSEKQAAFWNEVYENGLGEFFYRNKIDFRGLIQFPIKKPATSNQQPATNRSNTEKSSTKKKERLLVPVGGGKDSTVTIELLKKEGHDITLFRVGKHPLIEKIAKIAGLPLLTVDRHLSPTLFDLNAQGALNGHVPITAYISILTIVIALLYDFDAVVMSNERSASYGNVEFHGKEINHQWSKGIGFERMLQEYIRESITDDVSYFSLLRPFSELGIAKMFSKYPQYFHTTTSCNTNWKILTKEQGPRNKEQNLWCGTCPKCAFVFALYAAFLPKKTVLEIFEKNLFDDASLIPIYRELVGLEGFKPFECVGTPEEVKAAFLLARERGEWDETAAMTMFERDVLPSIQNPRKLIDDALQPGREHVIPKGFSVII